MMTKITDWQRIEYDSIPIYVRPDIPDWFVPNQAADEALVEFEEKGQISGDISNLLKRIEGPAGTIYFSRSGHLNLDGLKECWLHITNRCNLECRHCMFQSSPRERDELEPEDCNRIIREVYALGCRLFFFTGGEPLLAEAFFSSVQEILQRPDTHIAVLTNLSLLPGSKDFFQTLPQERLHFQVSVDGLESNHDALRGPQSFRRLNENLAMLRELGFPITLSMTVNRSNVGEMAGIIDFASSQCVSNVHFLWLFRKGNANEGFFVDPDKIFLHLKAAWERADRLGVKIDNIESIRSQVFSCPGTRYDLSNAGWQSLAIGPDGQVYPTPALVYTEGMRWVLSLKD